MLFLALTGAALVHRHHGRNTDAVAAATEALEIYRTGWPRRFGNRIDPELETRSAAAVCCAILGIVAADDGDGTRAAQLLGHAERLRGDAAAPVTALQHAEIDSARDTAIGLLGSDGFAAAFEQGRQLDIGELLVVAGRRAGLSRAADPARRPNPAAAQRRVSALLDGEVVPHAAGSTQEASP